MKHTMLILLFLASAALLSCTGDGAEVTCSDNPVMLLRFRGTATYTDDDWDKTLRIINDNPGCCDEVWFSSGLGFPPMEVHRERAERIRRGTKELESAGVGSSLQIQMTIGHGDNLAKGEEHLYSGLTCTEDRGTGVRHGA